MRKENVEKYHFFVKNLLTNLKVGAIISKVAQEGAITSKNRKKISKKAKKLLKKVLTKGIWCGIISKSLRERRHTVIEN